MFKNLLNFTRNTKKNYTIVSRSKMWPKRFYTLMLLHLVIFFLPSTGVHAVNWSHSAGIYVPDTLAF